VIHIDLFLFKNSAQPAGAGPSSLKKSAHTNQEIDLSCDDFLTWELITHAVLPIGYSHKDSFIRALASCCSTASTLAKLTNLSDHQQE